MFKNLMSKLKVYRLKIPSTINVLEEIFLPENHF